MQKDAAYSAPLTGTVSLCKYALNNPMRSYLVSRNQQSYEYSHYSQKQSKDWVYCSAASSSEFLANSNKYRENKK